MRSLPVNLADELRKAARDAETRERSRSGLLGLVATAIIGVVVGLVLGEIMLRVF
jgi:hypothetical protein